MLFKDKLVTKTMLSCLAAASLFLPCAAAEPDFIIGATTHFGHKKGFLPENLKVFKESGLVSTRDDTSWRSWEQEKGVYSLSNEMLAEYLRTAPSMGLKPLQIIGYPNKLYDGGGYPKSAEAIEAHAKFCEQAVSAWKGKCFLYQVWNEWDGGCGVPKEFKGQGDAKSYAELLKVAYPRMKAVDPSITVIANSVCTGEKFLEDTLKAGVLTACDGIAFHSYEYGSVGVKRSPESYVERIAGVEKLVKSYNDGKEFPIYLTETGWPNHIKRSGSTDAETGDRIARTYLLIKTIPSVKGLWWYDFQDDGLDPEEPECNFGIVRTDLTPKEPYYVIKSIADIIKKGKFIERMKCSDDGLISLKFKMPDGQDVLAAWCVLPETNLQVTLKNSSGAKGPLKTFVAGFDAIERDWGMRLWATNNRHKVNNAAAIMPDRFMFTVRSRPFIVMGDLSGVELEKVERISFPDQAKSRNGYIKIPGKIGLVFPESKPAVPVKFGGPMNYRSLSGGAAFTTKDIDASFTLSYGKDSLNLVVEVLDDTFFQNESGARTWIGDSVQLAFQNLNKKADLNGTTEYTLALTEKGSAVYREFSQIKLPEGQASDVKCEIKREGNKTVYSAQFPLKELGFKTLEPDMLFGFSILVNDNDGNERKGYLHWGEGIGSSKDPSEYNWLMIKE